MPLPQPIEPPDYIKRLYTYWLLGLLCLILGLAFMLDPLVTWANKADQIPLAICWLVTGAVLTARAASIVIKHWKDSV